MSVELSSAALWIDMIPARKLVLVALCDRAEFATGKCWPGREEIAQKSSLSLKSVTDHLKALEDEGWLRSRRGNARRGETTTRWVNTHKLIEDSRAAQDAYRQRVLQRLGEEFTPNPEQLALGEVDDRSGVNDGNDQVKLTDGSGEAASLEYVSDPSYDPSTQPSTARDRVGAHTREGGDHATDDPPELVPPSARPAKHVDYPGDPAVAAFAEHLTKTLLPSTASKILGGEPYIKEGYIVLPGLDVQLRGQLKDGPAGKGMRDALHMCAIAGGFKGYYVP